MDRQKLYTMIQLARFEQDTGKEDLKISKYEKRDYMALVLLKNFFLCTIGYILLLALLVIFQLDFLMTNFSRLNMSVLIPSLLVCYVLILFLYSVAVYRIASARYDRARKHTREFRGELKHLSQLYRTERAERRTDTARRSE